MAKHQSFVYQRPKTAQLSLLLVCDIGDKTHGQFNVPEAKQIPTYGCHNRCCQELGQSAVKPPGQQSLTAELKEG